MASTVSTIPSGEPQGINLSMASRTPLNYQGELSQTTQIYYQNFNIGQVNARNDASNDDTKPSDPPRDNNHVASEGTAPSLEQSAANLIQLLLRLYAPPSPQLD